MQSHGRNALKPFMGLVARTRYHLCGKSFQSDDLTVFVLQGWKAQPLRRCRVSSCPMRTSALPWGRRSPLPTASSVTPTPMLTLLWDSQISWWVTIVTYPVVKYTAGFYRSMYIFFFFFVHSEIENQSIIKEDIHVNICIH